jgi:16S rRNA (guanine527-N7)-methyltransferase
MSVAHASHNAPALGELPAQPGEGAAITGAASFAGATAAAEAEMADLEAFRGLLGDWNQRMNLVGAASLADFWPRHAWDSAQLLRIAPDAKTSADIGAGAGFPGVVLAVLLKRVPGARVVLIESQAKRCRFLETVAAALDLPAEVLHARAEDVALKVDIVAARAVAPLTRLLGFARPMLDRGARGLFLKGQGAEAEIAEARRTWRFAHRAHRSLSDPDGRILEVWGVARGR